MKFYKEFVETNNIEYNEILLLPIDKYANFVDQFTDDLRRNVKYDEVMTKFNKSAKTAIDIFANKTEYQDSSRRFYLFLKHLEINQRGVTFSDIIRIFKLLNLFEIINDIPGYPQHNQTDEYKSNRNKIASFIHKNKDHQRVTYNTYKNDENQLIGIQDIFNCLREMFSVDDIKIYEIRSDTMNFFLKNNTLKRFMDFSKKYYYDYIGLDKNQYPNVKWVELMYMDIWELLDFYMILHSEFHIDYKVAGNLDNLITLKKNLEKTIKHYENRLQNCTSEIESKIINGTLQSVSKQLQALDSQIKHKAIDKKGENFRLKCLKKVFLFYCKFHTSVATGTSTFDSIDKENTHLSIGDWNVFCRDFKIKSKEINIDQISYLYKKIALGKEVINFTLFMELIHYTADKLYGKNPQLKNHDDRMNALYDLLDVTNKNLSSRLVQNNSPFPVYGEKQAPTPLEKEQNEAYQVYKEEQSKRLKKVINSKIVPSSSLTTQRHYTRLHKSPQNTSRQDIFNLGKYGRSHLKTPRDVIVTELKSQRENKQTSIGTRKLSQPDFPCDRPIIEYPLRGPNGGYQSYSRQKRAQVAVSKNFKHEVSWASLGGMGVLDLRGWRDNNFEPSDQIGSDDEEDKQYLEEYNLEIEKDKTNAKNQLSERKYINYGVVKPRVVYKQYNKNHYNSYVSKSGLYPYDGNDNFPSSPHTGGYMYSGGSTYRNHNMNRYGKNNNSTPSMKQPQNGNRYVGGNGGYYMMKNQTNNQQGQLERDLSAKQELVGFFCC